MAAAAVSLVALAAAKPAFAFGFRFGYGRFEKKVSVVGCLFFDADAARVGESLFAFLRSSVGRACAARPCRAARFAGQLFGGSVFPFMRLLLA